jgi:DNA-directed RNA polymerase specialized sigma subunit
MLMLADVSEVLTASIIRAMMEAVRTSETSVSIPEDFKLQGYTISSEYRQHSELTDRINGAERLSQVVLLFHNSVAHTKETLQEEKFETLDHASQSPDLATSDSYLFWPFKEALRGHRFAEGSGFAPNTKCFF